MHHLDLSSRGDTSAPVGLAVIAVESVSLQYFSGSQPPEAAVSLGHGCQSCKLEWLPFIKCASHVGT